MRPGRAAVGRRGEADIRSASVGEAAHLKCRNDRRSDRVAGGLDLGLVLAGGIGERVVADLGQRRLRCRNARDRYRQGE